MSNNKWYFADEHSAGNDLTDEFTDSKFTSDKWESFAREIIQNSIDAVDDDSKPVQIVFDLNKNLTIKDIPACDYTKYVLEESYKNATNPSTKNSYKKGLEILDKKKIYCLKISDYNTKGVCTGRDGAWGALVFDTGKSVKFRSDSAGSHGVGKKAPFIISCCNTVFYSTKNKYQIENEEKSDVLFQGKTQLITWIDKNTRKNKKGWYGKVILENDDENRIQPLNYDEAKDEKINDYFLRKEQYGTDVIIVGVNFYDENELAIKKQLITSIISNFYVGILSNKLVIKVLGETIDYKTFDDIFDKWIDKKSNIDLKDYIDTFREGVKQNEIIYDSNNNKIGSIDIYFKLDNTANKKNYWIIRSQGMRIEQTRVMSDQPFTCIVHINEKELNNSLLNLENAAHNSFVIKDETMEISKYDVDNLNKVKETVKNFIMKETQIKDIDSQNIESLDEIINLSGSKYVVENKQQSAVIKKNPSIKKGKTQKEIDKKEGKGGHHNYPKERKEVKQKLKKAGNGKYGYIYDNYEIEPVFARTKDKYKLKFKLKNDIDDCMITIRSINSEGKTDSSISELIKEISIDGENYKFVNGSVKNLKLVANKIYMVTFCPIRDIVYQVSSRIYCNKLED